MNKLIIAFMFTLMLNSLQANERMFSSPKVALKMIDKQETTFIHLDNAALKIKKSKALDMNILRFSDILGRTNCSPFYVCSQKVAKCFSNLGISNNQALVIYDDSYGIEAATLYVVLESLGHKKISILRGGVKDIERLDPNWKIYINYLRKISSTVDAETIKKITQKINILKPHLLLQDTNSTNSKDTKTNYIVANTSPDYFLSREELKEAVKEVGSKDSNISIIDACEMIDIVGKKKGSFLAGVKFLSWKKLIDKDKKHLKTNEELESLFKKEALDKNENNYIYCMSGAPKAFYLMMALREVGYVKVKAFTGDWNTWVGDIDE